MAGRYLVLSDLHLCDVEEHADGWKAYKRSAYLFDDEIAELVDRFVASTEDAARPTLVLNGDVFDFDLVTLTPDSPGWHVSEAEKRHGLRPTEEKSVWKLEQMLAHHPSFVRTLARFLGRGHSLVYVLGNHDREFHFEQVRATFLGAIRSSAASMGLEFADESVRFEPWFFHVPGEIYVEHGNQYDHYTSFRHLLWPLVEHRGKPMVALPMGNLTNRHLLNRMGFFNPHASDYILDVYRYAVHWFHHYAFSPRSLLLEWLLGSLVVMSQLLDLERRLMPVPPQKKAALLETAARFGLSEELVGKLEKLQRQPITSRFFGIVRELWIDRVLLAILLTGSTVALALSPIPLWVKLVVPLSCFPLSYFIYEELVKGETIFTIEHRLPEYARSIARLLPVKVVTFGHTHKPRLIPLGRDLVFVDTGTWAPIMQGLDDGRLVPGYRNYLVADFTGKEPSVQLLSYCRAHVNDDPRTGADVTPL